MTTARTMATGEQAMQQDWRYYLTFAAGAVIVALFFRRQRRSGRHLAVLCAILAVVGLLLIFGAVQ